ncbi:MAG: hypothetical protein M3305_08020 [Actinomycetota bacterium]|nr:hypothetical protein [Actinomycetota bacterium]
MTDARGLEAESTSILEDVRVSRRVFLRLSSAGIAGLSLLWAVGCGGSQDGGNGNGKKDKKVKKDNSGGGY